MWPGRVHGPVLVLWRGVHGIELDRYIAGVDQVVARAGWDDDGPVVFQLVLGAVEHHGGPAGLDADELVDVVDLLADFVARLDAHQHELAVPAIARKACNGRPTRHFLLHESPGAE